MTTESSNLISEWYESKRKEAAELYRQLMEAKKRNAPASELERLQRLLDSAYYVGD